MRLTKTPLNLLREPPQDDLQELLAVLDAFRFRHMKDFACTSCHWTPKVWPKTATSDIPRYLEHQPFGYCYVGAYHASLHSKATLLIARSRANDNELTDLIWSSTPRFSWQTPSLPCYERDPLILIKTNLPLLRSLVPEMAEAYANPELPSDWLSLFKEKDTADPTAAKAPTPPPFSHIAADFR